MILGKRDIFRIYIFLIADYVAYLCLQDGDNRSKLNTLIKFPITDLDMTNHLIKGQTPTNSQSDLIKQNDYIYDLYGVCNHEGDMSQGHYKG